MSSILIIEDKPAKLDELSAVVNGLDFSDVFKAQNVSDAVSIINDKNPKVVLADYKLGDRTSCVDIFQSANMTNHTSVIVITDYFEEKVMDQILQVIPAQFLNKSCTDLELKQALLYASNNTVYANKTENSEHQTSNILVKVGDRLISVIIQDIYYLKVDGKYLDIHLENKRYSIRSSLAMFLKIVPDNFIRIHGSYVINLDKLTGINPTEQIVLLNNKKVPYTRGFKRELMDRFLLI